MVELFIEQTESRVSVINLSNTVVSVKTKISRSARAQIIASVVYSFRFFGYVVNGAAATLTKNPALLEFGLIIS